MNVALVDVSYSFWSSWHAVQGDHENAARRVIAQIRNLQNRYGRVIACCDKGESFRKALYPEYKATREEKPPAAGAQLRDLVRELASYVRVASADGYEGDDIIATLAAWAQEQDGIESVHIHAADKDLYQCVGGKVSLIRWVKDHEEQRDARWVHENMGCMPPQVPGWLALVGDSSDNLPGVNLVGTGRAKELFRKYDDLPSIIEAAQRGEINGKVGENLKAAFDGGSLNQVVALAKLKTDAPINCEELMSEVEQTQEPDSQPEIVDPEPESEEPKAAPLVPVVMPRDSAPWSQGLEPSNMDDAFRLARAMDQSGLFTSQHRNAQSAMAVMIAGRELGIPAIAALRGFHVISTSNKTVICPSAHLLVGICRRFEACEYFRIIEFTPERCTWETKRKGDPPVPNTWTIDQANAAGLTGRDVWRKYTRNMLSARASSELARLVYPDVVMNTYAAEEMAGDNDSDIIARIQQES